MCASPCDGSLVLLLSRDLKQGGQWWRWDYHADPKRGNVTMTALMSWARPCHDFRLLHDAGGGRLVDHSEDAAMLPLVPPGPGLDVRNERRVSAILSLAHSLKASARSQCAERGDCPWRSLLTVHPSSR